MEKSLAEKIALVGSCYAHLAPGLVVVLGVMAEAGGYPQWKFAVDQVPGYRGKTVEGLPRFEYCAPMFKPGTRDYADPTPLVDQGLQSTYKAVVDHVTPLIRSAAKNNPTRLYLEEMLRALEKSIVG